ncbi:MAG: hypothetical protein IPH08_12935 [Rhodocyclaceae bacterium]|jgi:hypothetical protein|nr:hypothetical protein [Rhodocyclaceae bacterium]MBK6907916.1 hypothetical protein [Rhodocyclaceae bacterium]
MSYARFDDEASYRSGLGQVLALAERTLYVFDRNLADMNFESPALQSALLAFIDRDRGNRLHVLLHDTNALQRHMPRTIALIARFAHAIEVRQVPDEYRHLADCHILADARHGIRRFHTDHPRGSLLIDNPEEVRAWWNRYGELWEQSTPLTLTGTTGL